jgi:endonuclease VIII-like 3
MLKNAENSIASNNLVKYPCNNFGITYTEVKINRKTVFGTTTLVLTDFSNKSSTLERKKIQTQTLGGEFQNSLPTNVYFSDTQHPTKERTNYILQPSNKVSMLPTVCSQSKLFSPAHKKLKATHYSSPDLKSGNHGIPNRYDASDLGI